MTLHEPIQTTDTIVLTPAAADAVRELLIQRNLEGYALRVYVSGGGCSGLQYGLALENNIRPTDLAVDQHGVKVVVDEISIDYLNGATIDYVDGAMGSGFKIENPNLISTCGCGSSRASSDADPSASCGCSGCR